MIWLILSGISLLVTGIVRLAQWSSRKTTWRASQNWPTVTAQAKEPSLGLLGAGGTLGDAGRRRTGMYLAYNVNGTDYEKDVQVLPGVNVGDQVPLFYDPQNPARAVVSRDYPEGNQANLTRGLLAAALGVVLLVSGVAASE